jgi:hypothetical protein
MSSAACYKRERRITRRSCQTLLMHYVSVSAIERSLLTCCFVLWSAQLVLILPQMTKSTCQRYPAPQLLLSVTNIQSGYGSPFLSWRTRFQSTSQLAKLLLLLCRGQYLNRRTSQGLYLQRHGNHEYKCFSNIW